MNNAQNHTMEQAEPLSWISELADAISDSGQVNTGKDYCELKCRLIQRRLTLIYPSDLAQENPELLFYLNVLARQNDLKLLQERRKESTPPLYECRKEEPPILALGIDMLLQQTGLTESNKFHLTVDEPLPQVCGKRFAKLLKMGEQISRTGKQVSLRPNRFIYGELVNESAPITGFASKVVKGKESRIFSHFTAENFHAIGYTKSSQFIFHVFAGGGFERNTKIWGPLHVMTREPLHFRLYRRPEENEKFGVLYSSYTLNLQTSANQAAYWTNNAVPQRQMSR